MGLDIYLYKLTKPRLKKSKTYTEEELSNYETSLVENNNLDADFIKKIHTNHQRRFEPLGLRKIVPKIQRKIPRSLSRQTQTCAY